MSVTELRLLNACEAYLFGREEPRLCESLMREAISAARAQAEDDAKPIDDEWLESVGFESEWHDDESRDKSHWLTLGVLTLGKYRGEGNWQWYFDGFCGPDTVTRGDVWRLLEALKIEERP